MSNSRINNSIKNSIVGFCSQILVVVLSFVSRSIFIYILGNEFLGVNGLFSNILSMLSLSEMGIGTAIVYNMYKAVSREDTNLINSLLSFYAKVYRFIGLSILAVGLICSFFIQYLIKDNPFGVNFIRIAFILQVINNSVSYFWSYRSSILFVYQKDWICKISNVCVSIIGYLLQIIALIFTKSYFIYLVTMIIITILSNLSQYMIARYMYPDIKVIKKSRLPKDIFNDIFRRVKALIIHSISSAINFGTDNIIISSFVGIVETGFYSNYSMIINTINGLIVQFLNGIIASMGNLMASSDSKTIYDIFKKINFLCQWLYGLLSVCLICLLNQFIDIWTGKGHLLGLMTVIVLVVNFYILGVRQSIMITRNAGGLFEKDKIVAVIKPIINLFFSIILVINFGIIGVFIGTLISQIVADVFLFPYFLYKSIFSMERVSFYYLDYLKHFIISFTIGVICYLIVSFVNTLIEGSVAFIVNGLICVFVFNLLFIIINIKCKEFIFFKTLLLSILKKVKSKFF